MTSVFEDIVVDKAAVFFDGDYEIIESVTLRYRDWNGDWTERSTMLSGSSPNTAFFVNLDLPLQQQDVWQDVQVLIDINEFMAEDGDSITASFATWGLEAIGLDSGAQLTLQDMTPSSDIVGYEQTVKVIDECSYDITLADGSVVQSAVDITMWTASSTPNGATVPGYQEVTRVNVANASDCEDAIVRGFDLSLNASWDESVTVRIKDLSTGTTLYLGTLDLNQTTPVEIDLMLSAGNTHTLGIYADLTNADAPTDDWFMASIAADSLDWYDWLNEVMNTKHASVNGEVRHF